MTGNAVDGTLMLLGLIAVVTIVLLAFGKLFLIGLDAIITKWRRMGIVPRVVAVMMAAIATVEAQKSGMGDFNRVERVGRVDGGGGDFSRKEHKESVWVDGEVLKLGVEQRTDKPSAVQLGLETSTHLLVSVKTNDSYSYAMPENAVRYPNWWIRGGYEDVFKLELGDWRFPIGTNLVDYLWVYTWGKVRPRIKAKELEIAAVGSPMSAVPQVSEFWYADGANSSKILTWHNFFLGRVPLSVSSVYSVVPIFAQLELFPSGDYIARSNLVERYFKRINPDDFDDDGIPDGVDENPELSDGDFFGPDNDLPEGANSNNYCSVDVVVSNANSLVTFIGDRPSNLPDPCFIAKPDVTNRVTLLIGKTYRVTSAQPIICTAKSNDDIIVDVHDSHSMTICYPVSYEIVDMVRSVSRQIRMIPPSLVGTFNWNTNTCCTQVQTSPSELPKCAWDCTCEGCTSGGFTLNYEGYSLSFDGVECGCKPYSGPTEDDGPYDASASVGFSEKAIIFEDAYENKPGESVPKQSTRTVLSCVAHGGPNGGRARFTISNAEKLVRLSGIDLPMEVDVPAGNKVEFNIVYEGGEASGSENDIVATAQFIDNKDGALGSVEDELTVVKVELRAVDQALENPCVNRHVFGVYEWVECLHYPAQISLQIEIQDEPNDLISYDNTKFFCPWAGGVYWLKVKACDDEYRTRMTVVEPKIVCRNVTWVDIGVPGRSGLLDMRLALYVEPRYVSFKDLHLVEIPDNIECPRSGYFSSGEIEKVGALSHTESAGAGKWGRVFSDASWMADRVSRVTAYPQPWIEGWKEWRIPVGWGDFQNNLKGSITPDPTTQLFTIDSTGTATIRKYGHEIKRAVDNRVWIDNVLQN